jgi:hypothetical protein
MFFSFLVSEQVYGEKRPTVAKSYVEKRDGRSISAFGPDLFGKQLDGINDL